MILRRLPTHRLLTDKFPTPAAVVAHFGAVQAQDLLPAMWALGLRLDGATEATIDKALNDRQLVRTWPLRNTVHFVTPADIRWMLQLSAPRALRHTPRHRQLELDDTVFAAARKVIAAALADGQPQARPALRQTLDDAGIPTTGQRGIHIMARLAQEGLICLGPRQGKQHTFVLLDAWLPPAPALSRDEALAELAWRYFSSHGPATVADFIWWSGLAAAEARAGLEMAAPRLAREMLDGATYWFDPAAPVQEMPSPIAHLLPFLDEYLVAYKDRSAVVADEYHARVESGNIIFHQPVLMDGRVVGIWTRRLKKDTVEISANLFRALTDAERSALEEAAGRLGDFLGLAAELETSYE